jgi:hypothetical protein
MLLGSCSTVSSTLRWVVLSSHGQRSASCAPTIHAGRNSRCLKPAAWRSWVFGWLPSYALSLATGYWTGLTLKINSMTLHVDACHRLKGSCLFLGL